jgi:hypothetical protein
MEKIWIIGTGKDVGNLRKRVWNDFSSSGLVGIDFEIGHDISTFTPRDDQSFDGYINSFGRNIGSETSKQFWQFLYEIDIGHWIVARRGVDKVLGIGRVTSDYQYREYDEQNIRHFRNVEWLSRQERTLQPPTAGTTVRRLERDNNWWGAISSILSGLEEASPVTLVNEAERQKFTEGRATKALVKRIERSSEARRACIEHYMRENGWDHIECAICTFSFNQKYGEIGDGFIHIHHLKPLHEIDEEYQVNPEDDLVPVCPNCHAMLHKETPPLTVKKLQKCIAKTKAAT